MGSCENCLFYSEKTDELNRDFNDTEDQSLHFCPMYTNGIPNGVFEGQKDCEKFMEK